MGKKLKFYWPYTIDPNHHNYEYDSVIRSFNEGRRAHPSPARVSAADRI